MYLNRERFAALPPTQTLFGLVTQTSPHKHLVKQKPYHSTLLHQGSKLKMDVVRFCKRIQQIPACFKNSVDIKTVDLNPYQQEAKGHLVKKKRDIFVCRYSLD